MRQPFVEILYFEDCPNHEPALATVRRVAAEVGLEPTIELLAVPDAEAATAQCFLGSPTVRIDGRDVEPGSDERRDFGLSCRVYRHNGRVAGEPDEAWIREALTRI
jgi:hypothetical protein